MERTEKAVEDLSRFVLGSFNHKAWNDTRPRPFATRERINALRRFDTPRIDEREYQRRRLAYYHKHPSAPGGPVCSNCGQWQNLLPGEGAHRDCLHECVRRGLAVEA